MPDRYPQVMRLVSETPWAIRPEKLAAIKELLAIRASGHRLTPDEVQARIGSVSPQRQSATTGSVAVIPVYGVIVPRADLFSEISGGTSIQGLSQALSAAVADDSIGAILLDVDSPGGSTNLVTEFAAEIREARAVKPVVAIANTAAASAAYWLASQADELVVTPSGLVGSIGVYAAHEDISGQLEQDGVRVTLVKAGKYKAEANPFEELSDDARAAIQDQVDQTFEMFLADVAAGRGVSVGAVRSGYGEGRVVLASDAVKLGMADRVDTFEATVERLIVQAASGQQGKLAARGEPPKLTAGPPPGAHDDSETTPAAESGLSFAQTLSASRSSVETAAASAGALRALTAVKRDDLVATSECWKRSAAAIDERVAEHDAGELSDEHLAFINGLPRSKR